MSHFGPAQLRKRLAIERRHSCASLENVEVAGKTGTAQWGPKHKERTAAWFAGFLPADQPRYAFAVVYEGDVGKSVHGGSHAAPMIAEVFKDVYKGQSSQAIRGGALRNNPKSGVPNRSRNKTNQIKCDQRPTSQPLNTQRPIWTAAYNSPFRRLDVEHSISFFTVMPLPFPSAAP